eukprot:scaffold54509_cov43-Cyclotella_meneghiniana.AAC.1
MSSCSHPPSRTGSEADDTSAGEETNTNENAAPANNFNIVEHEHGSPSTVVHPITQVKTPPPANASSSMNAAIQDNQDQRITECITDAMSTLDPSNFEPPGPITDVIPHPHSPFGHLYYHAIRNNPVVMQLTNNASITVSAHRIFALMRHFNLSGQSPDDDSMPDNILLLSSVNTLMSIT